MKVKDRSNYMEFLASKHLILPSTGIEVAPHEVHPMLFPFQRELVLWALRKGRAAIFADCGLGKTFMQLEWARLTGERCLIVAPLAVAQQTVAEAAKLGITLQYCRDQSEVSERMVITNYEMLEHFNADAFGAVVLDESSILKSYMGKTKQRLIDMFRATHFKLCCTATPAPNDILELGNHSEFLGIMPSTEMISRWFINNTMQAGDYRLKGHAASDFWRWVSTWAMSLGKPSDIGFSDEGFVLPPMEMIEHTLDFDATPPQGMLFDVSKPNATTMHRIKRESAELRAAATAELVGAVEDYCVIWCDTNYEADTLKKAIPEAVELRGSESVQAKTDKLTAFTNGETRILITKPDIAGLGLNWQHCANVVFVGLSYSFEKYYQAMRRTWRFGQKRPVNVHVVQASHEADITASVWRKAKQHQEMNASMINAVREHQLNALRGDNDLKEVPEPTKTEGANWQLWLGDCVDVSSRLPADSVDFSIFSPPFSNLYIYSDSMADMGNSTDDEEFFKHFGYVVGELHRITVPGRICAVHCKDLPLYKGRDGAAGLRDFPGETIRLFESYGWTYHSRVTIWKSPVTEMQRTKNHGLLHKILCDDSANSRQGMADYMIMFRKWEGKDAVDKPVNNGTSDNSYRFSVGSYVGTEGPETYDGNRDYSIQVWQRYASPVWYDINQMNVLNYRSAKDSDDEKHIAPLQLDVIERSIHLWSNPGEIVFSPFAGIGSEGYVAVKQGRKFIGVELKEAYYNTAIKNLRKAEQQQDSMMFEGLS